jgi:hypothetical protein
MQRDLRQQPRQPALINDAPEGFASDFEVRAP